MTLLHPTKRSQMGSIEQQEWKKNLPRRSSEYKPSIQKPRLNCEQWMNRRSFLANASLSRRTQASNAVSLDRVMVFNLLLEFTDVFSGYGSVDLSIRNQERHTGGFCPKSISSCLIECWQILLSILEWANTTISL